MTEMGVEHLNLRNLARQLPGHRWLVRARIESPYRAVGLASDAAIRSTFERIAQRNTSPDGTFGLKVMWSSLNVALLRHHLDLDVLDLPITWVRIRRVDDIAQAVSLARAHQTKQWVHTAPERRAPRYDADLIADQLFTIRDHEAGWDEYMAARGVTPYAVTYEQLDADYDTVLRGVFDHLGSVDRAIPPRQTERQADQRNVEWAQRFRAERGP